MRIMLNGLAMALACLVCLPVAAQPVAMLASPDAQLAVAVSTDPDGRVLYSVTRKGQPLINPSRLGFLLQDSFAMVRGFRCSEDSRRAGLEDWEQPWGERRFVKAAYTELLIHCQQTEDFQRHMQVRFRLFNDGIGFRYELPDQPNLKTMKIAEELTEFDIAQAGTAWWIAGGEWNREEQIYQKTAIDAVATAYTPITMRLEDGTHLTFHEAAIVDYAAYWFKRVEGRKFRTTLAPSAQEARVIRATPFVTPWRTIRVADSAAGLVENDLELNLNEPNKIGDVSWFRPHKYIGIWWGMITGRWTWSSGPDHGATTQRARHYIDFAARNGFQSVLIEGWNKGWDGNWLGRGNYSFTEAYPDFDLKAVTDYARRKGVRIIGHHETGGNLAVYESQLDAAMQLYARSGINAVKTGYVADAGGLIVPGPLPGEMRMEWHDGQRSTVHHQKVVETAARYKIAINAHEPVKDSGLRRTYPNWIGREGARGMEYNAWGQYANSPDHEPTLIYARMLAGPMDFTPGVLSLTGANGVKIASTLAKQLGLYVTIYSPIQMAADFPEELAKYPRALRFIAQVPTDWAESHLLDGAVGDYAVLARKDRNSADWYMGGVNDADPRTLSTKLDFLDAGRRYIATIYRDGPDADYRTDQRHSIVYETRRVKKGDVLQIYMAPAGGFAVRFAAAR